MDCVLYEKQGAVALLTLNRPEARNAIDAAMTGALRAALKRAIQDVGVRAIVLAANGPVFCAGMDLKAFLDGDGDDILFGEFGFAGFVDATAPKPIIAAIHGPALAGGCEIALACDLLVAGPKASFGLPEVKVGLFPVAGGAYRLARKIPPARALELVLTGDRISAEEATSLGLVNRLAGEGEELSTALDLAQTIAANAPLGVAGALKVARCQAEAAERALWLLSEKLWDGIRVSEDAVEGPKAFAEKRAPVWSGR